MDITTMPWNGLSLQIAGKRKRKIDSLYLLLLSWKFVISNFWSDKLSGRWYTLGKNTYLFICFYFTVVVHCFRMKLFLMCIIVLRLLRAGRTKGGLQEGEAISGLDIGRFRNKTFYIKRPCTYFCLHPSDFQTFRRLWRLRFLLLQTAS